MSQGRISAVMFVVTALLIGAFLVGFLPGAILVLATITALACVWFSL